MDGPELLIFSTLRHFSTFCHLPSSAHHFYSCHRCNAPCLVLGGSERDPGPQPAVGDAVPGHPTPSPQSRASGREDPPRTELQPLS